MAELTRTGPKNAKEGTEIRSWCGDCGQQTVHSVVRSAEYQSRFTDGNLSMMAWLDCQIVECKGCQRIGFRRSSRDTESTDRDPVTGEEELVEFVEIYPTPGPKRALIHGSHHLPQHLYNVYDESLKAMQLDMPVLAGIGIRAIVETICRDKGADAANLKQKIDQLVDQRVLTKAGAEILHSLRTMGNDAAHEVKPHEMAVLKTAMDVVENAIQAMYILPKEASKLPKPR